MGYATSLQKTPPRSEKPKTIPCDSCDTPVAYEGDRKPVAARCWSCVVQGPYGQRKAERLSARKGKKVRK